MQCHLFVNILIPISVVSRIFRKLGEWFGMTGWAIAAIILYALAPGMWLGQVLQYFAFSFKILHWKDLWGMKYPEHDAYKMKWYEYMLIGLHALAHLYKFNIFVTYAMIVSMNISYCMCIVADHDTAEAAVTNHIDVDSVLPPIPNISTNSNTNDEPNESLITNLAEQYKSNYGKVDWGEAQVRNSSNFCNHWASDLFAFLHGSINYQIEHHLFPGISHIHLPKIAPIVKQTCKEFKIPYVSHPNLFSVAYSFLNTIHALASPQLGTKESKTIHMKKL